VEQPKPAGLKASDLIIGLDADDTLWDNESHFAQTEDRFALLASEWATAEDAMARLVEVERANVGIYGYGVKSFMLSMIETIIDLSGGASGNDQVTTILGWGKELLSVTPDLLDGVVDTVQQLAQDHRVLILTKGDLHHQGLRVDGSGLRDLVDGVEIMAEKDVPTYRRVLDTYGVDPHRFVMVGNSVKSDVLPVRELGGHAVHIPFHVTWALERVDEDLEVDWFEAKSITEVPGIIQGIENGAGLVQR